MRAWLCVLLALCAAPAVAAPPAWADLWPRNGRVVFEVRQVSSGLVVGRSEHRWQHDGKEWSLRSVTEPAGVVAIFSKARAIQESRGMFVAAGLQPLEFRTEKNGKARDRARFDPVARRVELTSGEQLPFVPPTQDLLSLFYQVGAMNLAEGRATLHMTTGRKLREYQLVAGRSETLDTALGPRGARLLTVTAAGEPADEERTEIWLDAATRLPLLIRYRDRKGEVFDQAVMQMSIGDKR